MNSALNNIQGLISHKTKPNQTKPKHHFATLRLTKNTTITNF